MLNLVICLLASVLLLSACGGEDAPPTVAAPAPDLAANAAEVQSELAEVLPDLVDSANIEFGSVVASVGSDITGVDSTFDGNRAQITIQRRGKSPVRLDTNNTFAVSDVTNSLILESGRQSRSRYVFSSSSTQATSGLVAVDWNSSDTSDYLSGGYWIHAEANPASIEFGAFVDGQELDLSRPARIPTIGTAQYGGTTAGMYVVQYGTDISNASPGSLEAGEFFAITNLTANFGSGTISGCAGCIGGTILYPVGGFETLTPYQLHLGPTPINRSNGTFEGTNVRLTNTSIPIVRSSGRWAGQFSNRTENGSPRLVAGTIVGKGETAGGSHGVFIGAFGAGN